MPGAGRATDASCTTRSTSATGWAGFDFEKAFGKPTKVINDATMQALGSYEGGRMLFLGLGTGLGSTMILDGVIAPMELGHLAYKQGRWEDYVGEAALERLGQQALAEGRRSRRSRSSRTRLEPDYVVLGGGNARELGELPPNCRLGHNEDAFLGGFRLWVEGLTGRDRSSEREPRLANRRCSTSSPRPTTTSDTRSGGKSPCSTTPVVAESRAASARRDRRTAPV